MYHKTEVSYMEKLSMRLQYVEYNKDIKYRYVDKVECNKDVCSHLTSIICRWKW